jgi:hypothetical protein
LELLKRLRYMLCVRRAGTCDQLLLQELIARVGLAGRDTLPIRIARLLKERTTGLQIAGAQGDLGTLVRDQPARHCGITA